MVNAKYAIVVVVFAIILIVAISFYQPWVSKEQKILSEFLNNNLNAQYMPQKLNLQQGVLPDITENNPNLWGYVWQQGTTKFYVSLEYNSNSSGILNNILEIFPTPSGNFNLSVAASLVQTYLKQNATLTCAVNNRTSTLYCENYLPENNGNKLFVGSWYSNATNVLTVFACEIPVGSEIYAWKSCAQPFKDTGV